MRPSEINETTSAGLEVANGLEGRGDAEGDVEGVAAAAAAAEEEEEERSRCCVGGGGRVQVSVKEGQRRLLRDKTPRLCSGSPCSSR